MPKVSVMIRMPESLRDRYQEAASEDDRSMSNLMLAVLRANAKEWDQIEGKEPSEYKE